MLSRVFHLWALLIPLIFMFQTQLLYDPVDLWPRTTKKFLSPSYPDISFIGNRYKFVIPYRFRFGIGYKKTDPVLIGSVIFNRFRFVIRYRFRFPFRSVIRSTVRYYRNRLSILPISVSGRIPYRIYDYGFGRIVSNLIGRNTE